VRLDVKETYTPMAGMEDDAIYLSNTTYSGSGYEAKHIVEVDNIAPSTDVEIKVKKNINLVVQLGDSTISETTINSYINNTLKAELESQGNILKHSTILKGGSEISVEDTLTTERKIVYHPQQSWNDYRTNEVLQIYQDLFFSRNRFFNPSKPSLNFHDPKVMPDALSETEYEALFDPNCDNALYQSEFDKSMYHEEGYNAIDSNFNRFFDNSNYGELSCLPSVYQTNKDKASETGSLYHIVHHEIWGKSSYYGYFGSTFYLAEINSNLEVVYHVINGIDEFKSHGLITKGLSTNDLTDFEGEIKGVKGHDDWLYIPSTTMRGNNDVHGSNIKSKAKVFDTTNKVMMDAPVGIKTYTLNPYSEDDLAPRTRSIEEHNSVIFSNYSASDYDDADEKSYQVSYERSSMNRNIYNENYKAWGNHGTDYFGHTTKSPIRNFLSLKNEEGILAIDETLEIEPYVIYMEDPYGDVEDRFGYHFGASINMGEYALDVLTSTNYRMTGLNMSTHTCQTLSGRNYYEKNWNMGEYYGDTDFIIMKRFFFKSGYRKQLDDFLANASIEPNEKTYYVLLDNSGMPYMRAVESQKINSLIKNSDMHFITDSDSSYANEWLGASDGSKIDNYSDIANAILSDLSKNSASGDAIYVTSDEALEFESFYNDFENDPLYAKYITAYHTDPNYFDNANGTYALDGVNQVLTEEMALLLPKVGYYTIYPRVRDNPVGKNETLDAYRKWSDLESPHVVIVNRKPIANGYLKFNYDSVNNVYNTLSWVDTSYDLDHNVSLASSTKGITATSFAYRLKGESRWHATLPNQLAAGTYEFKIRAKDMEGLWSDDVIKTIALTATPTLQFDADLTTADVNNPLTAFKTNNDLKWVNVWSRYPYPHHLELSLWDDGTRITALPYQTQSNSTGNYTISGQDRFWHDILFHIPSNIGLTDKTYQARIEAVSELNGERSIVEGGVIIVANEPPTISSSVTHASIVEGESNAVTIAVDDPDKTNLNLEMNIYKEGALFYSGTVTKVPSGGHYENQVLSWANMMPGTYSGVATVNDGIESVSTNYSFTVMPNAPPTITSSVKHSVLYEGESNEIAFVIDDPDKTALSLTMSLDKDGALFYEDSTTESPYKGAYTPKKVTFDNLPAGSYTGSASVSDGTKSSSTAYTFKVLPFRISSFDIYGVWSHWRGQVDKFGEQLSNMPHRFLSFESITFKATLDGMPDGVSIRLSPELEAMVFEDDYGHEYDYTEEVGEWVYFPLALTCTAQDTIAGTSTWEGKYILPLASSTLNWDNDRVHRPYKATLTAVIDDYTIESTIDDIELTGNIKDLIYMQPSF